MVLISINIFNSIFWYNDTTTAAARNISVRRLCSPGISPYIATIANRQPDIHNPCIFTVVFLIKVTRKLTNIVANVTTMNTGAF